ncbi:hypothetical protein OXX80_007046 [Metschnikowia pulcherrima]
MTSNVPTVHDITFYSNVEKQETRYASVKHAFSEKFGVSPEFFSRAPGRVNLIGEHIDYCHFSVLPMAIEVDVIAAIAARKDNIITIANTDGKFGTVEIPLPQHLGDEIPINKDSPTWADYFKCGLVVARKYMLESENGNLCERGSLKGFFALFDGTVPTGGGLSSSAAFCIAATLAVLRVNGVTAISKADLTKITVVCEHYVGLSNGGMDQSASINGEDSKVLLVSFKPELSAVPFKLPATDPETVFLISNSLVTANKTETAPQNYNLRVVEVAIAADIIAQKYGLNVAKDSNIGTTTLRGVFDAYFTQKLGMDAWDGTDIDIGIPRLEKMLNVIEEMYNESERDGISVETATRLTNLDRETFEKTYLSHFPVKFSKLNIYRRSRHVYSDSLRVLQTLRVARNFSGDSEAFLREVGALMDSSQQSTSEMNQASTAQCDEICALARKNGSFGSRVTGAGFGGCIVHLTTVEKLPQLVSALTENYYEEYFPRISAEELSEAIVVSKPAMGACIVQI